jgi:hypothetical protein
MPSESVEEDGGPDLRRLAEHGGNKCAGCTGNYHHGMIIEKIAKEKIALKKKSC